MFLSNAFPLAAPFRMALTISGEQSSMHPLLSACPAMATTGSIPVSRSILTISAMWLSGNAAVCRSSQLQQEAGKDANER